MNKSLRPVKRAGATLLSAVVALVCGSLAGAPSRASGREVAFGRLTVLIDAPVVVALGSRPRVCVRATVTAGGTVDRSVGLHLKGNFGAFQPYEQKPSLTLHFNRFVKGQSMHGLHKLHLNSPVSDPTYLTEILCRKLFEKAGVQVARASHSRLELNGRDARLYVLVEGFGGKFLKRFRKDTVGNLYDSEFRHDIMEPLRRSGEDSSGVSEERRKVSGSGPDVEQVSSKCRSPTIDTFGRGEAPT